MSEGAAFSVLGHSCGGIKQEVFVQGFAPSGYPTGAAHLETKCGGSGRGGGYHVTTYTASASVVWTWFGETRSYSAGASSLESTPAEDAYSDKLYNIASAAYLETGTPPVRPPAAPSNVAASVALHEAGSSEYLQMTVDWTEAPETAGLVKYSTITATPVGSSAPVLTATTSSNYFSSANLGPVEPNTTYSVTVTNTDSEGISEPGKTEVTSPNSDGEATKEQQRDTCASNHGTIRLNPGLTETPTVQSIVISGELSGCEGPDVPESAKYTVKEKTTEEVTCSYLQSASTEPTTTAGALTVKWLPPEEGTSKGTLEVPVSETALVGIKGSLKGGPIEATTQVEAPWIDEAFTGVSTCGIPQGHKAVVKPVKGGTFTTGEVELG
ncbi:MAG: hypothetical protein ACYDHT_05120 [Solirubrobacteraceae bacterium]